jgi:hypothetical protein
MTMRPYISFRCPACRARIKAPPQLLDQVRPCPGCRQRFVVRPDAPEDAGVVLLRDERAPPPRPFWARQRA